MFLAEKLYEYSRNVSESGVKKETEELIRMRIIDSIFVSFGAAREKPVSISRATLLPSSGRYNSRTYFFGEAASVDVATFINGTMTRYLDYSDTYLSKEALHPSDNIPPILCCADAMGFSEKDAIASIAVSYQVACAFADSFSIRAKGWDHVTYISISSAAGLASLMGLEKEGFVNAISLSLNNSISMRQTRAGELSMWKGCTAADAARNGVFASLLASEGMTGPSPIFEGEMGFFAQVSGSISPSLNQDRIGKTMIKNYPVEYHAMSAVDAALYLRTMVNCEEVISIYVETFSVAYNIIIKGQEKLKPKTKETADHSMPYIIAYVLEYGVPNLKSYSKKYLSDKKITSLIKKMSFKVSEKYNRMYPGLLPVKITIKTKTGNYEKEVLFPKGHYKDPYTWEDLRKKGISITGSEEITDLLIREGKGIGKHKVSHLVEVISNVKA